MVIMTLATGDLDLPSQRIWKLAVVWAVGLGIMSARRAL